MNVADSCSVFSVFAGNNRTEEMDSNLKVLKNPRCVSTGCTDVNVIVPEDNGRRKRGRKFQRN